jgi:tRNA A37 threonylcarbamoyladenosine modification protein TsaB
MATRAEKRATVRILAFDSSGNGCSAAVWKDGRIVARAFETRALGSSP